MNSMLIEPVYAGSVSYFQAIAAAGHIVFDVYAFYEKRSYRNRCEILGANGILKLSIPLEKGKHQKQILKDVRISYAENWQKDHWVSITSAYRRAAFFEFYEDQLWPFYESRPEFLIDLQLKYFDVLNSLLQLNISYTLSEKYTEPGIFEGEDLRDQFLPNNKKNIKSYLQVFADRTTFVPDLSILDLLFNLGSRSKDYLKRSDLNG